MTPYSGENDRRNGGKDHDLLIGISKTVEGLDKKFDQHIASDEKQFEKHEQRIVSIEKVFWKGLGALSVIFLVIELFMRWIR